MPYGLKWTRTRFTAWTRPLNSLKETSGVKFDASVELHAALGIDIKKSDQLVRATIVMPHGTGKTKTIAAFVAPDKEKEAKKPAPILFTAKRILKNKRHG